MISRIFLSITICIFLISVSSCSNSNSDLELENAQLKLKIYEDSIKRLNDSLEIELNPEDEKNDSKLNKQIKWLKENAFTNMPIEIDDGDRDISRIQNLDFDGSFTIETRIRTNGSEHVSSILSGNLEYLDFLHSEIIYPNDEKNFYVRIPCQSKRYGENCIQDLVKNNPNHDEVLFGPYTYGQSVQDTQIRDTLAEVISGLMDEKFGK